MRKLLLIWLIVFLLGISVSAANGDIISKIYTTDILTYVDNIPIKGYAINGKTMICLEDLKDYGFSVIYDDAVRMLIVTKTGNKDPEFKPCFERGKVGGTAGFVYETDIVAIVNGVVANAYAIDGRMVASVEDLGADTSHYENGKRIENCGMTFEYDNDERKLWLSTQQRLYETEQGYDYWKTCAESGEALNLDITPNYSVFWFTLLPPRIYDGDYREQLYTQINYNNENGFYQISLNEVLKRYGIDTHKVRVMRNEENNNLYVYPLFETDGKTGGLRLYLWENETYEIDPYTLQMRKLNNQ